MYLSFDIEIYNEMTEENKGDLRNLIPSVGAFCTDYVNVEYYYDKPYMSKETAQRLVLDMLAKTQKEGYTLFGWNTLSFDLQLLAHHSGMYDECGRLALSSVDGMFLVVAQKGFFLGLDKALVGANIETKLHEVTLKDNTKFSNMDGSKAPLLWREGEYDAVMDYLRYDVIQPLKLANHIEKTSAIRWKSNAGRQNFLSTKMLTVKDALKLPVPDTSWMSDPKPRKDFYSWIPENVLKEEGVI